MLWKACIVTIIIVPCHAIKQRLASISHYLGAGSREFLFNLVTSYIIAQLQHESILSIRIPRDVITPHSYDRATVRLTSYISATRGCDFNSSVTAE